MLPIATTTISVLRSEEASGGTAVDPYGAGYGDDPETEDDDESQVADTYESVASGVRAHISSPSGIERVAGGSEEEAVFRLSCDETSLEHTDRVVDEATGTVYEVQWAEPRPNAFGLGHVEAGLVKWEGIS